MIDLNAILAGLKGNTGDPGNMKTPGNGDDFGPEYNQQNFQEYLQIQSEYEAALKKRQEIVNRVGPGDAVNEPDYNKASELFSKMQMNPFSKNKGAFDKFLQEFMKQNGQTSGLNQPGPGIPPINYK